MFDKAKFDQIIFDGAVLQDFVLPLAESITMSLAFEKALVKTRSDLVVFVEAFSKMSETVLSTSESFLISELLTRKGLEKVLLEETSFGSVITTKEKEKIFSESFFLTEIKTEELSKIVSSAFVITEAIKKGLEIKTETETLPISEATTKITEFEKVFSEVLNIVESIKTEKTSSVALSAILNFAEALEKVSNKPLTESIDIVEQIIKVVDKRKTESLSLTELEALMVSISISSVFNIVESMSPEEGVSLSFDEALSIAEVIGRLTEYEVSFSEELTITEILSRTIEYDIILSEVFNIVESLQKVMSISFTSALSITESLLKKFGCSFVDNINLSDSLLKTFDFKKIFSDLVSITEVLSKDIGKNFVPAEYNGAGYEYGDSSMTYSGVLSSNILTLVDSFSTIVCGGLCFDDTVALAEALSKETGKTLAEIFSILESVDKTTGTEARLSDNLSPLTEQFNKLIGLTFTENFVLEEIETPETVFTRVFSDPLLLSEEIRKDSVLSKKDSLLLAELLTSSYSKQITDDITLQENILILSDYQKILDDSILITETLRDKDMNVSISEVVSILDLIITKDIHKTFDADVISFIESLQTSTGLKMSETFDLAETLIKEILVKKGDALDIVENIKKEFYLSKIDITSLIDISKKHFNKKRQENIVITESLVRIPGLQKTELVSFSDTFKKGIEKQNIDGVEFSDLLSTTKTFKRSITDSIVFEEDMEVGKIKIIQDLFSISEALKRSISIKKGEVLVISEEIVKEADKKLVDEFDIADSFDRTTLYNVDLTDVVSLIESLRKERAITESDAFDLSAIISILEVEPFTSNKTVLLSKKGRTILITK